MIYVLIGVILIFALLLWAERGSLIRPSTVSTIKEMGLTPRFLYMYVYARWTSAYLTVVRLVLPWAVRLRNPLHLADTYHAKVLPTELARQLITINEPIPLQDLEQIIPYPAARHIVLDHPLDIVVTECPCRKAAPSPCSPSMVCMVVGKPFTDFMLEHHPDTSKRLSQQQALDLLEEVHRQGCIHAAYFKDVCLDRFYVICNCCKCCCVGLHAMRYGIPSVASSGFVAQVDKVVCSNCGACQKVCPFNAINENNQVEAEKCMGCGVCVSRCKTKAISLKQDASKGLPLEVRALKRH